MDYAEKADIKHFGGVFFLAVTELSKENVSTFTRGPGGESSVEPITGKIREHSRPCG